MKKITLIARISDLDRVRELLADRVHRLEQDEEKFQMEIYLHDEQLDELVAQLRDAVDLRYRDCVIEVETPDFVISSKLMRDEKTSREKKSRTPIEKLIDSTRPYERLDGAKIALASIAGLIAMTGLFRDNVAIIIGAMLLSPLLGPIYSFAINTALGRVNYALTSIVHLLALLVCVMGLAWLATLALDPFLDLPRTTELRTRFETHPIFILTAVLLGFASILAFSRGVSEGATGVAIAAALLPPAVAAGIGLAIAPGDALRALLLTLENVVGLMVGGLVATLVLDIGPRRYYEKAQARRFILRTSAFLAILLGVLLILALVLPT